MTIGVGVLAGETRTVRVPEIHVVVKDPVSLATFRSEDFEITVADHCSRNYLTPVLGIK